MGDFKVVKILGELNTTLDIAGKSAATVATGDLVAIADIDDGNNIKKVTAQSIADLSAGFTSSSITGQSAVTPASGDLLVVADISDSNNLKKVTVQSILDQVNGPGGTGWIVSWSDFTDNVVVTGASPLYFGNTTLHGITSGTGVISHHANSIIDTSAMGVRVFTLPSSAGYYNLSTDDEGWKTGQATTRIGARVKYEDVPVSGGEDYYHLIGVNSKVTDLNTSNYAVIGIQLTDNATNFVTKTHNGTSETVTDTGVAFAADTWFSLEIEVSATESNAWINGTQVLTAGTVPAANTVMAISPLIGVRVGTPGAVRKIYYDWAYIAYKNPSGRSGMASGGPFI